MSRGEIHRPADVMVFVFAMCAGSFAFGMGAQKSIEKPIPECAPGYIYSARTLDGKLICDYERSDWRRPIERRVKK